MPVRIDENKILANTGTIPVSFAPTSTIGAAVAWATGATVHVDFPTTSTLGAAVTIPTTSSMGVAASWAAGSTMNVKFAQTSTLGASITGQLSGSGSTVNIPTTSTVQLGTTGTVGVSIPTTSTLGAAVSWATGSTMNVKFAQTSTIGAAVSTTSTYSVTVLSTSTVDNLRVTSSGTTLIHNTTTDTKYRVKFIDVWNSGASTITVDLRFGTTGTTCFKKELVENTGYLANLLGSYWTGATSDKLYINADVAGTVDVTILGEEV